MMLPRVGLHAPASQSAAAPIKAPTTISDTGLPPGEPPQEGDLDATEGSLPRHVPRRRERCPREDRARRGDGEHATTFSVPRYTEHRTILMLVPVVKPIADLRRRLRRGRYKSRENKRSSSWKSAGYQPPGRSSF